MTPDTMRAIDYWAGVPLCFLLTRVRRLIGRSPARRRRPQRLLFIELSEMGSTILADPAMRKAKRTLGGELYFVIFSRNAASLAFLQTIPPGNVFTIREDGLFSLAIDTLRFLVWTRRNSIDSVIDLELFSRFTAILSGLCGADHRVGFHGFHSEGLYRGNILTHKVAYNPHMHIAKNFVALVNALISPTIETPYSKTVIRDDEIHVSKVNPSPEALAAMRLRISRALPGRVPGRIVLLNPNASELLPQRRWPRENFARLAQDILGRWSDVTILITGAPDERESADALAALVHHPRMLNFAGFQELAELPALYGLASLMVTNDSGPGHFAAVTDMATIVLFGPETPALYGPLGNTRTITAGLACSPCVSATNHRKTACTAPVCMAAILPETVLDAVAGVLNGGEPRNPAVSTLRVE